MQGKEIKGAIVSLNYLDRQEIISLFSVPLPQEF